MFKKDGLINFNLSAHSPHQIISSLLSSGSTILDVGCNTGLLGKHNFKKAIFDGIDINKQALIKAKPYYRHLLLADLSLLKNINLKNKYDFIIFSDILEHLPRPDLTLIFFKKYLKPGGSIIISLPNIARFEIRLQLLFGKFEYTQSGILNQDHLRYFTKKSATDFISKSGYRITKIIPTGLGHQFNILPNLTAFQFIYVAQIK
jgi:2-polyprenyl-3-methyl-5-hydroxy-6-metoxy-1,4-benzoquinol methylase